MKPLQVSFLLAMIQIAHASSIYDENAVISDNKVIRKTQRSEELTKLIDQQKLQITEWTGKFQACDQERTRILGDFKTCNDQLSTLTINIRNIQTKYDTLFISFNDSQKQLDKCNSDFKVIGSDQSQQIKKLTDQLADVTRQSDDLQRRAKKAEDLVVDWQARYKALQDQVVAQKNDLDTLVTNYDISRKKNSKLDSDLSEQTARTQRCLDDFAAFRDKCTSRDNDSQVLRDQLKKTQIDLDSSNAKIIKINADYDVLRQSSDRCRKDFDIQTGAYNDLQAKYGSLDQKFGALTIDFNNLKITHQKSQEQLVILQKNYDVIFADNDACRKANDNLKVQIDQLNITINEYTIKIGDFKQRVDRAETQITTVTNQCRKDRQDVDRTIADLNNAVADWQGRFKARDADCQGTQDRFTRFQADWELKLNEIRGDRDSIRKSCEDLKISFRQSQDTAAQCDRDLRSARDRGDRAAADFLGLKGTCDQLQLDFNGLNTRFKTVSNDFGLLQDQSKRCSSELILFKDRTTKAEDSLGQLNSQISGVTSERDQLRKAVEDFKKQVKVGQDKLDKLQKQYDKTLALCDLEVGESIVGSAF